MGRPGAGADLDERLTGLALAARAAAGRLDEGVLAPATEVLARADERRGVGLDLTVVALAGPTGSGKSSLVNALVGRDVAASSPLRPTTDVPMAALWTSGSAAGPLLDWLGVQRRHVVGPAGGAAGGTTGAAPDDALATRARALDGLVLVDLPDLDSTVADHRLVADRLVARADALVWVLDPQKYADGVVHEAYLRSFARHAGVTVVVLNKADTLPGSDVDACRTDLGRLLAADGFTSLPPVLSTSARTGRGLDGLRDLLAGWARGRRAAVDRLSADVATAAAELRTAVGDPGAALVPVSQAHRTELDEALAAAAGVELVEAAVGESVRRRGRRAVGWPALRWVGRRGDPLGRLGLGRAGVDPSLVRTSLPSSSPVALARVSTAARAYAAHASGGAPEAWVRSTRRVAVAAVDEIAPALDEAVARADVGSPRAPRWWRLVGALQWGLLVVAVVGGLWLLGLAGLAALALDPAAPPRVGGLPVPTLMLVVGALSGLVLAVLAGAGTRVTARHAARRARAAVRAQVSQVAEVRVCRPVAAELATLADLRTGLAAASVP